MEKLLEKDLKSLVVEDIKLLDALEVLVVNDGSKDASSAIAHKFEDAYPQTFRVIDKENGNYGSCINRGLKEAKGKYIRIMDADDWYDTKNFEIFLRKLETIDADKVATIYTEVRYNGNKTFTQPYTPEVVMKMEDVSEVCYIPMHAITYKTQFLRDINYTQTEGMSYTDQEWILLPMPYVKTLCYIDLDVYQYYIGRDGQTMDPQVMCKAYPQLFHALNRVVSEYHTSLKSSPNQAYVIESVTRTLDWLYGIAFFTARFQGNSACVRELDVLLEKTQHEIWEHLGTLQRSALCPYQYVDEWRKKGRPEHMSKNHELIHRLKHFYVCFYRFPIFLYKTYLKK